MRFKPNSLKPAQPELVASKDVSRPVLTKVHLNAERSRVEVTDSYMLATFPVELEEGDTSGPIPVDALKAARKPPDKYGPPASIRANGSVDVVQGFGEEASAPYITLPRDPADYTFPNCEQLIPEADSLAEFTIGLNPAFLFALAKSMGSPDRVQLRFCQGRGEGGTPDGKPNALRPFLVRPLGAGEDDPSGLLMPMRLNS